jgi:hypothetical protein
LWELSHLPACLPAWCSCLPSLYGMRQHLCTLPCRGCALPHGPSSSPPLPRTALPREPLGSRRTAHRGCTGPPGSTGPRGATTARRLSCLPMDAQTARAVMETSATGNRWGLGLITLARRCGEGAQVAGASRSALSGVCAHALSPLLLHIPGPQPCVAASLPLGPGCHPPGRVHAQGGYGLGPGRADSLGHYGMDRCAHPQQPCRGHRRDATEPTAC